ncbi:MAG: response regulator [Oscillospiraceae bacterium]|nr:response regulator [Oscillospiraceae bacterium]
MKTTAENERQKGSKISARFRNSNMILLAFVLALITFTAAVIATGIADRASEGLAYLYSMESVDKFNLYIGQDLALVKSVANSNAVTGWFDDEGDPAKRAAAYTEMMDFVSQFNSAEMYFGIDKSKNEYSVRIEATIDEFMPFDVLDPGDPYNDWYFNLVNSTNDYSFNIDVDKVTNEWRIWVNHKVIYDGAVAGVFCSGLPVDEMLMAMYANYDRKNVKGFVIDRHGVIRLCSDSEFRNAKNDVSIHEEVSDSAFNSLIDSYLCSIDGYFGAEAHPEVVKLSKGSYRFASIAPIVDSDWLIVTFFNSNSLFSVVNLAPLLFALAICLVIYIFISTTLTRRFVLSPLSRLTTSVSEASKGTAGISGSDRDDEIGELARKIQQAWNHINETHQRAKLMLDATPLCCFLLDSECICFDCNAEATKLFKVEDKHDFLERFFEFSPERQNDGDVSVLKAKSYIRETFETGHLKASWTHRLPDGALMPAEVTLVRVNYDDSYVVVWFTRDLREQERMIRDIEQRDVLLSTVNNAVAFLLQAGIDEFESALWSSMGIMAGAVDADRVRLWRNQAEDDKLYCTQLYEWSEGAVPQQGNPITINVPYDEDLPGWEEKLSCGQCINCLTRDLTPKVHLRLSSQGILSVLIVPVFLREEFWGFVGFNDCHKERLFTSNEESVLRSASLLIANALLRNEMTNELSSALEKTQAASKAKSNFLSNMSHEIRTPINAIVGMTMIGKAAPDPDKKNYAFEKIEVASSHLLGVINDVLDMSKIEANKFELSNVEFDFEKMLQKVVNVIVFRVNEKCQKLAVDLDPEIPQKLIGDDQRLAQVITNLLSNAVKFTSEGGAISLHLHFLGEDDGLCTIQIEVEDSGIGISEEQQERLFLSFEQAESDTSRKFGGTGLGLSISKQIVGLMNGEIWVESTVGKGSTFKFTAKLQRAPDDGKGAPTIQTCVRGVKLLAVDDESDTLEYFDDLAQRLGIDCDTAADGFRALEMIGQSNNKYDICFVDWKMPEMDGIELSRQIRAIGSDEPVIIMISAYDWLSIKQEAKGAGVNGFLSKPLFSSDVVDCINTHVGAKIISTPDSSDKDKGSDAIESFEGHRILVVEDVEINREIVIALLEPTFLEIDCAVNGLEAVQIFSEAPPERYDMIFMDMQMPEMDGLTATRLIRALDVAKAKEIPIVAMTANVFKEDVEKCLEAGMNDHIGKPIDFDDMMEKLNKYLKPK